MESKKRTDYITPEKFSCVKILLEGGASMVEASKYTKISKNTISRIKAAQNYTEYQNMLALLRLEYKKKKEGTKQEKPAPKAAEQKLEEPPVQVVEHRQSVTVVANHYMMEELKTQTEYLKLIKNVLTVLAEDLGCFKEGKK